MNHKINQDVIRKHARVPRTYREATGNHLRYLSDPGNPPSWLWYLMMACAAVVVFFIAE